MLTKLPSKISTVKEAKALLTDLHRNGEAYHCEDDATDIEIFTHSEGLQLNRLMEDIYNLEGNKGQYPNLAFDPCEFLLSLDEL